LLLLGIHKLGDVESNLPSLFIAFFTKNEDRKSRL
jgi:hypothetical protein